MSEYELKIYEEIENWKRKMQKKSGLLNRISKKAQNKVNELIPEKAHQLMTDAIKNMVKATLTGSHLMTKKQQAIGLSLAEKDQLLRKKLEVYRKTAAIEGAGTGAGGIFLGLADFPLLLSIKMKFLFEAASIYGYDTSLYEERLFLLHVFQLAFSSDQKRQETLVLIEEWEERKKELLDMDWREFQQEYRDYIDFVKMLQLVPGVGAVVGAYANYNLLDHLGETAMNAYRLRLLKAPPAY
ncbi:ABC transporter-associated protein EcsC [Bacillus methanolicus]|uniref:EcsC family protein n=1 Tax=Bacillus methanolicus TaxID=1471 RepID=UPI002380BC81|nr:EcsC family protein [Bacillus methanolicus]MDE3838135.1 ABC transporter-associated protein EcsC [Bacillus methanolicus]